MGFDKPPVKIKAVWKWHCPTCGHTNTPPYRVAELSAEEAEELRNEHGVQPWQTGDWVVAPTIVDCLSCGDEFDAEVVGDHDDDV